MTLSTSKEVRDAVALLGPAILRAWMSLTSKPHPGEYKAFSTGFALGYDEGRKPLMESPGWMGEYARAKRDSVQ